MASFQEVFLERYCDLVPEDFEETEHVISVKKVELVGMNKVAAKIEKGATHLDFNNKNLVICGEVSDEIRKKLSDVEELNLSNNSLTSWFEVVNVVKLLPKLQTLLLSGNKLEVPFDTNLQTVLEMKKAMSTVKRVVFGDADQNWFYIQCVESHVMPLQLEALEVFKNKVTQISKIPYTAFLNLKYLDLSMNSIDGWQSVSNLGKLPKLEVLILASCDISKIYFESEDEQEETRLFSNLKELSLRSNKLTNWIDIAELNKLKSLESLNVRGNPLFNAMDIDVSFYYTLCRVFKLKKLNREEITDTKRKEAALYYIRNNYDEWLNRNADTSYVAEHPNFVELLQKYGGVSDIAAKPTPAVPIQSKFIDVILAVPNGNELRKKLPASTTILNLKTLVRRVFKIDSSEAVELEWKATENFSLRLDDENGSLHTYAIDDNDTIIVKY